VNTDPPPEEELTVRQSLPGDFETEVGHVSNVEAGEARVPQRIGPLEMKGKLGQGGMGIVYRARHIELNSDVAVKFLNVGEEADRFLHEARTMARLSHPGIVRIHHVDTSGDTPYMVMDLIHGETLARVIRLERIPPRRGLQLCAQLCRIIAYAHSKDVIHRDLKPGNIMLVPDDPSWELRVMDFGLAKHHDTNLTRSGSILGTPGYMSPEQAQGWRESIGPRSDVYSIGAVLYEMLTGMPPFSGDSIPEILYKVVHTDPLSPRQLNPTVDRYAEAICLKALDKEPRRRYQTSDEMASDIDRYLAGKPIEARPMSAVRRAWRKIRRNRLASVTLLSLAALMGYLGFENGFPGAVTFEEFPVGSWISIDASSPRTLAAGERIWLLPGYHRVVLTHPQFEPYEGDLHLRAGRLQELTIKMIPANGMLVITSQPYGARIEGRPTGGKWRDLGRSVAGRQLRLSNGPWQFRLTAENYQLTEVQRVIAGGQTSHIEQPLAPLTAMVTISGGPGAVGLRLVHRKSGEQRRFTSHWQGRLRTGWHDVYVTKQNHFSKQRLPFHVRALGSDETERETNVLRVLLASREIWRYDAGDMLQQLVTAELTGDGCPDFIAVSQDHTLHAIDGFFGRLLWRHRLPHGVTLLQSQPDLTGDRRPDLLIGMTDATLQCISGWQPSGKIKPHWTIKLPGLRSLTRIRDQDRDGAPDLAIGLASGRLVLHCGRSGKRIRELVVLSSTRLITHLSVDLTRDGILDHVLLLRDDKGVQRLQAHGGDDGRLLWRARPPASGLTLPVAADFNADGVPDLALAGHPSADAGTLYVFDGRDGVLLRAAPIGGKVTARPSVGRGAGKQGSVIGVGSWNRSFSLFDGTGRRLWRNEQTTGWIQLPGAIADLDGDGKPEVVFGATDRRLRVLSDGGTGWDYLTPRELRAVPLLLDLDWDGALEIVAAFADGSLRAIRAVEPGARAESSGPRSTRPAKLVFGAPAYLDPAKLQELYRPLMAYLTRRLGLPCSLRVVPYRQVIEELTSGRSQLAVLSPLSYVLARERIPGLVLVASHLAASKSSFRGVVIVRDASPFWRMTDLAGKRMGYVDPDSTSGCLYTQAHLLSAGHDPRKFFKSVHWGQTHNGALRLLLAGKVDAVSTFAEALESAAYHGLPTVALRVIDRTEPIPYDAYVARPDVPPALVRKLRNALLRLDLKTAEGRRILGRAMRIDGWLPPDDRRYDGVRRVLKLLKRHGVR